MEFKDIPEPLYIDKTIKVEKITSFIPEKKPFNLKAASTKAALIIAGLMVGFAVLMIIIGVV